jgi:hypothetical protein
MLHGHSILLCFDAVFQATDDVEQVVGDFASPSSATGSTRSMHADDGLSQPRFTTHVFSPCANDPFLVLACCRCARRALQRRIEDEMTAYKMKGTATRPMVAPRAIRRAVPKGTPVVLVLSWLLVEEARTALVVKMVGMVKLMGAMVCLEVAM